MLIVRKSPFSGKINEMNIGVTQAQLDAWHKGALIQDVMPSLSSDEREFLMSGYTPEDWEAMFGKDES